MKNTPQKTLILLTALSAAGTFSIAQSPARSPDHPQVSDSGDRPNIVLIVTDDQNLWDFGAYGGNVHTPHVDRLAREGIRFDNAYTVTTVCSPSRYTTLTGRYPGRCAHPDFFRVSPEGQIARVSNRSTTLERDQPNLMKALQESGYKTGITGKWHLGTWMAGWEEDGVWLYPPGFHEMRLKSYPRDASFDDPELNARLAYNQKRFAEELKEDGWDEAHSIIWMNPRQLHHDQLHNHNQEWITHGAIEFIEKNADNPFFLYMATTISHIPDPQDTLRNKDDPRLTGSGRMEAHLEAQAPRDTVEQRATAAGAPPEMSYMTWLDDGIGAIIEKLEALDLDEKTIIIFLADHGLPGKASLYETGTHIPMIVYAPNRFTPGIEARFAQNVDITPTILDLTGTSRPSGMKFDGRTLKPLLERKTDSLLWRDDLYFEYGYSRAIRHGNWKYVSVRYPPETVAAYRNGEAETLPYLGFNASLGRQQAEKRPNYWETDQLYNLDTDPDESTNLAFDPRYADILVDMKIRMIPYLQTYPDRPYGELHPVSN